MTMRQINVLQTQDVLNFIQTQGFDVTAVKQSLSQDNAWPTENEKIKDFRQMQVNQSSLSELSKKVLNAVFHHYDVAQFALV